MRHSQLGPRSTEQSATGQLAEFVIDMGRLYPSTRDTSFECQEGTRSEARKRAHTIVEVSIPVSLKRPLRNRGGGYTLYVTGSQSMRGCGSV